MLAHLDARSMALFGRAVGWAAAADVGLSASTIQPFSNWLWPTYLPLPSEPASKGVNDLVFFQDLLRDAGLPRALAVDLNGAGKTVDSTIVF